MSRYKYDQHQIIQLKQDGKTIKEIANYEMLKFIHLVYDDEDNIYFPRKFKKARYFRDNFSYNLR